MVLAEMDESREETKAVELATGGDGAPVCTDTNDEESVAKDTIRAEHSFDWIDIPSSVADLYDRIGFSDPSRETASMVTSRGCTGETPTASSRLKRSGGSEHRAAGSIRAAHAALAGRYQGMA